MWLGTAPGALDPAHARPRGSGEQGLEGPGVFPAGARARSTTGRPASGPSTAAPASAPIPWARGESLPGDRGEPIAARAGGMRSATVGYRPLRPRGPPRSATASPPVFSQA